jgi:orotidine-5'-phosphate decarboxylase
VKTEARVKLAPKDRVAVAFDVETAADALRLRDRLGHDLGLAKLGSALFVREGMPLVREFRDRGTAVFLDLKFHDIPSVVGKAVEKAVQAGVEYLTVHASGGAKMVEEAVRAAEGSSTRVLAVTVLTSLSLEAWREGASPSERTVEDAVARLAKVAVDAGAHGLVGSAREAGILRSVGGPSTCVVTPGVEIAGASVPDQARTVTVAEAIASGADILVVGRGVRNASDPAATLRSIQAAFEGEGS